MVRRLWAWVSIGIPLAFACIFAVAFWDRYWRVRHCFNELGRCFEAETGQVLVEQAGIIWGGLFVVSLMLGLIQVLRVVMAPAKAGQKD